LGIPQQTVANNITGFGNSANLGKPDAVQADHATEFDIIGRVCWISALRWKQLTKPQYITTRSFPQMRVFS
jgi:hypothetical protein